MAQIQITRFDRRFRYFRKKLRTIFRGLAPSKIVGRFNGPIVISNSIPKSGTHLIENVLETIPMLRNSGTRTLSFKKGEGIDRVIRQINRMHRGAFYNAHLPGGSAIIKAVKDAGIKVIFLIRDPRDIVVSRYKYITYIDKLHFGNNYMVSAGSDSARLTISITGIEGVMLSIKDILEGFKPWMGEEEVIIFRFEELIGEAGGGSNRTQKKALKILLEYIGYPLNNADLSDFQKKAFLRKSSTFRKGQIGAWKAEFEAAHIELFEREAGELLSFYGYEPL